MTFSGGSGRKASLGSCVKGLDSSAAIGDFVPVDRFKDIQNLNFHLDIDGKTVQRGNTADMLFKVDEIIAYVSRFFTFKDWRFALYGNSCGSRASRHRTAFAGVFGR